MKNATWHARFLYGSPTIMACEHSLSVSYRDRETFFWSELQLERYFPNLANSLNLPITIEVFFFLHNQPAKVLCGFVSLCFFFIDKQPSAATSVTVSPSGSDLIVVGASP